MNKCVLLAIGSVLVCNAAGEQTNWLKIGDQTVDSTVIDGKTVGDKWIVVSNTLIRVHAEVTPIPGPSDASPERSTKSNSEPCLRLLLSTGDGTSEWGRVKGLHGLMYMAADFRPPALTKTSKVDICSSEDNARIVVMVADNGPIYSSTNSGMTWLMINTPGKYEFFLTGDATGGGFKAAATIRPSPENQPVAQSPTNWYAIGAASDGSGLILTGSSLHAAPALSITRSRSGTIISWPSAFTGFVLQVNDDLSSTNWVDVPNPVKTVGQENQVFAPSPASNAFYRLRSAEVEDK